MRRHMTGALVAALALGACNRSQTEQGPAAQPSPEASSKGLEAARVRLRALELQFSEDAYDRPEASALVEELNAVPTESPDYQEARRLAQFILGKQRIAAQARHGEPPSDPAPGPDFGPKVVEGPKPSTEQDLDKARQVKVGISRQQLLDAFGSCLVRQTWFPGNGGPVNELFQIAPNCRDKFKPTVYRVAGDRLEAITEGNVDLVMSDTSNQMTPEMLEVLKARAKNKGQYPASE